MPAEVKPLSERIKGMLKLPYAYDDNLKLDYRAVIELALPHVLAGEAIERLTIEAGDWVQFWSRSNTPPEHLLVVCNRRTSGVRVSFGGPTLLKALEAAEAAQKG